MKIGIDARLWEQTGVGRYIRNLVLNISVLDKKNDYVIFIQKTDLARIEKELEINSSRFKFVAVDAPWHSITEQIKFLKVLNKEKLDLMHFTYFSLPIFYTGPFILTIHDLIIHHYSTGKASTKVFPVYYAKRFFYKRVIETAAKKAVKIIAVSNATKDEIVDHLGVPSSKIDVIYESADKFISKAPLNLNFPYILYVGNLYPHKNVEKALKAFKLAKKPKNTKFVVVGKEDFFRKRTEALVESLNLQDDVVFTGKITDEELGSYYAEANATIIPSLMEGFGLPALEAMRNGCLVACSDIPSLKEICRECAIYFNPNEIEDIKRTIEKLFTIKAKSIIEKAEKKAEYFSWSKMASETLKVYESSVSLRSS